MIEPREPVTVLSPELTLRLFQLKVFLSLASPEFYNPLLDEGD